MEKDNTQKELFEFEPPKKRPSPFGRFFQKTDLAVSLSAEKLVFISIGIIMLLVISFALGVEKGKSQSQPVVPVKEVVPVKTVTPATNITPKVKVQPIPPAKQAVVVNAVPGSYTIVAAAFTKEAFATKEAGLLKSKGFESFIIKNDPYYLACVGSFANKESAQKILNKVRQMHRDAYVRLR